MGWSYGWAERKELIDYLTDSESNGDRLSDCVAHCYRGNPYRGVLWSVWIISNHADKSKPPVVKDRYIRCDLLAYQNGQLGGEWGYKDMCESSHPYYYSCPLSYLDMVPEVACQEWRDRVREYHTNRKRDLKVGRTYKVISGVKMGKKSGTAVEAITIKSLKPISGTAHLANGTTVVNVKFKKRYLTEEEVTV